MNASIFKVETAVGTKFTNLNTGKSVYFQPGDDEAKFLEMLESFEDRDEGLMQLWRDYEGVAA